MFILCGGNCNRRLLGEAFPQEYFAVPGDTAGRIARFLRVPLSKKRLSRGT